CFLLGAVNCDKIAVSDMQAENIKALRDNSHNLVNDLLRSRQDASSSFHASVRRDDTISPQSRDNWPPLGGFKQWLSSNRTQSSHLPSDSGGQPYDVKVATMNANNSSMKGLLDRFKEYGILMKFGA